MLPTIEFKPKPQETVRIRDLKPGMCFRVPGYRDAIYQINNTGSYQELSSGMTYASSYWLEEEEAILVQATITCTDI